MKCECLTEFDKGIKEKLGDPKASVQTSLAIVNGKLIAVPYMNATYRKKKKDGSFASSETKIAIFPSHCPWCGVEIEQPVKKEDANEGNNV